MKTRDKLKPKPVPVVVADAEIFLLPLDGKGRADFLGQVRAAGSDDAAVSELIAGLLAKSIVETDTGEPAYQSANDLIQSVASSYLQPLATAILQVNLLGPGSVSAEKKS